MSSAFHGVVVDATSGDEEGPRDNPLADGDVSRHAML
jgi:hypothetical protein